MGVYIKGITMPKGCYDCPMLEGDSGDGLCHAASKWLDDDEYWMWYAYPEGDIDDSKPTNCPLIPVPDHGDLIDKDKLMKHGVYLPMDGGNLPLVYMSYVKGAEVVIPAERSEE